MPRHGNGNKKIPRLGDFYLSVAVQQLNDRQAVVKFLVGTQGLYIPMFVALHGPLSLRKVQTAHMLVFTNWRSEPFYGFSSVCHTKIKRPESGR